MLACFGLLLAWSRPVRARTWVFVREGTPLTWRPGTSAPDPTCANLDYQEDGTWTASDRGFGIGYGDGDDRTVLEDMRGSYLTVYVRARFTVDDQVPPNLYLRVWYDDGFVVYLNGQEVGRAHVPDGPLGPDDPASGHEVTDGPAEFQLDPALLQPGENVLAAEVHNASLSSSDLSFLPILWGYDTPPPDAEIVIGPFLQQVGRRSALVVWETDQPAPTTLLWGAGPGNLDRESGSGDETTHHVVRLRGLPPGFPVAYQVQSANLPSPIYVFETQQNRDATFLFGIYGDTRTGHETHRQVAEALARHRPAAVFHTGDLVADGTNWDDWVRFFSLEQDLLSGASLYPALGNHEADGATYLDLFELPEDETGTERYYSVAIGPALFVSLDLYGSDYHAGSEQYDWLEATLAAAAQDPNIRHTFVLLHHGPYDSGSHGSNLRVRNELVPLFETYGVSIVFSGHDHSYERGTVNGVKYVVTGGGGAPLYDVAGDWWTEVAEAVAHYCLVTVHGPHLAFQALRLDGSILDAFELEGRADGCSADGDCADRPAGSCAADEEGSWRCVAGACLWVCSLTHDGGLPEVTDAGPRDAAAPNGDGEAPDGGPPANGGETGCDCRQPGSAPAVGLWLAWLLVLARRKKCRSRQ